MPSPISVAVQGDPAGHLRLENGFVREAWGLQAGPSQKEAEGHGQGMMVLSGDRSAQSWACVDTEPVHRHPDWFDDDSLEPMFLVRKMPPDSFYTEKNGTEGVIECLRGPCGLAAESCL